MQLANIRVVLSCAEVLHYSTYPLSIQDADSGTVLTLLKKFDDNYMKLSSLSRSSTLVSTFNTLTKLPQIGVTLTTGHKGRSEVSFDNH